MVLAWIPLRIMSAAFVQVSPGFQPPITLLSLVKAVSLPSLVKAVSLPSLVKAVSLPSFVKAVSLPSLVKAEL